MLTSDLGDLIVLMADSPNPVIENACLHTLEAGTPARLFPPPPEARGTTQPHARATNLPTGSASPPSSHRRATMLR